MGDKKLDGRLESLSFADFGSKISQTRHGVDAGGKDEASPCTKHDLIKTARVLLVMATTVAWLTSAALLSWPVPAAITSDRYHPAAGG